MGGIRASKHLTNPSSCKIVLYSEKRQSYHDHLISWTNISITLSYAVHMDDLANLIWHIWVSLQWVRNKTFVIFFVVQKLSLWSQCQHCRDQVSTRSRREIDTNEYPIWCFVEGMHPSRTDSEQYWLNPSSSSSPSPSVAVTRRLYILWSLQGFQHLESK